VVLLLVSAFIVGCSSGSTPSQSEAGPSTGTTAPGEPLIKKVGETAAIGTADKQPLLSFVVDAITLDKKCATSNARPAQHGHFVMVSIRAETTAGFPEDSRMIINPYDFSIVGTDKITENGLATAAALSCLPQSQLMPNTPYGPSKTFSGMIVLDTENPTGTILYRPTFGGSGWAWRYPVAP
jgi:hypothetical protein